MKQYEAVIKVMEENQGFATLAFLYQNVLKVDNCLWKTRTPFASIRRIVQDERFFFKIKPGLWALKSYKQKLPDYIKPLSYRSDTKINEYSHSYYQGLIIEIGNFKKMNTFVANQDKNKIFLGKKLMDIASIPRIYKFSYDNLVRLAQNVDVIWFNIRKMPESFFEIEHTTDISNSLKKFTDLQDFYSKFVIIADKIRKFEFENKLNSSSFISIKNRVEFLNYDELAEYHSKAGQFAEVERKIKF